MSSSTFSKTTTSLVTAITSLVAALGMMADVASAKPMFDVGLNLRGRGLEERGVPVRLAMRDYRPSSLFLSDGTSFLSSTTEPGVPGDVVIGDVTNVAPFYVYAGQLLQVHNASAVLFANIVNTTDPLSQQRSSASKKFKSHASPISSSSPSARPEEEQGEVAVPRPRAVSPHSRKPAFKLSLSSQREGLLGDWIWDNESDNLKFMAKGATQAEGGFYLCQDKSGRAALYLDLDESEKGAFTVACMPVILRD